MTPEEILSRAVALLQTDRAAQELADELGLSTAQVYTLRALLGLKRARGRPKLHRDTLTKKASFRERIEKKYPGLFERLGIISDSDLGQEYKLCRERVRQFRHHFKIPRAPPKEIPRAPWKEEALPLLGTMTDTVMAKRFNVSITSVSKFRRSEGVPRFKKPLPLHEGFEEMWLRGDLVRDIAQHFKKSNNWVSIKARKLGLPVRGTRSSKPPRGFKRMCLSGTSARNIARHYDKSVAWVYIWKRKLGLPNKRKNHHVD